MGRRLGKGRAGKEIGKEEKREGFFFPQQIRFSFYLFIHSVPYQHDSLEQLTYDYSKLEYCCKKLAINITNITFSKTREKFFRQLAEACLTGVK